MMKPARCLCVICGTAAVLGVFLYQSKWLGFRTSPGDSFPEGYAGEFVDSVGREAQVSVASLPVREDGTVVYPPDPIEFEDAVQGRIRMDRPAVSLKEARRLGYDEDLQTPGAILTYGMRGPLSDGFTNVDANWLMDLVDQHEDPSAKASAVTLVAFVVTAHAEQGLHDIGDRAERALVRTFEIALASPHVEVQRAAVAMSDWKGWAEKSPTFVETLRGVAEGENANAERARYVLAHTFNDTARVP